MKGWDRGELMKAVLGVIALSAVSLAIATVPNAALLVKPFLEKKRWHRVKNQSLNRAIERLKGDRLVKFIVKEGKIFLQITEKGKKRLRDFEFDSMALQVSRKWNGVWTVILFDIPEYKKTARDALRRKLKELGCFQYHRSVFVHPSSCRDEIDFVANMFDVSPWVIHFETASLGNQEYRARKFFDLF